MNPEYDVCGRCGHVRLFHAPDGCAGCADGVVCPAFVTTPAETCCTDCQSMHRTPSESVRFHARLAREFAAAAHRHAERAERWSMVAFVALAVCAALLVFRAVAL